VIIACTQCHTRFKVPDGKVTARGLKVRCSRCGHTFRIFPESASDVSGPPAAAPRPAGPDPFQAFGPQGTSDMEKTPARGTEVSALLAQMGPPADASEDFDVDVSGEEPTSTEPAWNFPPAPARPGRNAGGAAVALQSEPAADLHPGGPEVSFAGLAEPEPLPARPLPPAPAAMPPAAVVSELFDTALDARPPEDDPFDAGLDLVPIPVRPLPPEVPSAQPESFTAEPFAPAGAAPEPPAATPAPQGPDLLAGLAGFTPAWGLSAPVRALSVDGTLSSHVSTLSPPPESQAPSPPPQYGGEGTVLDDLPALEPTGPLPVAGLDLDPGNDARSWTGAPPTGDGGMQLELESDLPPMELDRPPPAPSPDAAWVAPPASSPPATASPPPTAAAGLGWDDPFADAPRAPPPEPAISFPRTPSAPNSVVLDEAPPAPPSSPDHGFFEMPSGQAPATSAALLPEIPEAAEPAPSPPATAPMPAISKPPARARLGLQEREQPGAARRVSAVILNVGLAALLLLVVAGLASSWATAGRLEGSALSPRRLLQALRPGSGVTPVEVTPGTYETQSGRTLLYVRGRVLNRGVPAGLVRVRAEVWDGAQAVKSGDTLAGAIATPEELWRAATPAEVEALRARLLSAATPVADGQQADFLVVLDDAPRDLAGLRLKVSASVEH